MASQKGRDLLMKIGDGGAPEQFTTVAGVRSTRFAFSAGMIDSTNADSADAWREVLAGAGVRSLTVSGGGVFKDGAADALVRQAFFSQETRTWRLIVPSFGTFEGAFAIETLEYRGEHDGEAQFSVTLASAGAIGFTSL